MFGQVQHPRAPRADLMRGLGGRPYGQLRDMRLPRGDQAAAFHRHRDIAVLANGLGDDVWRGREDLVKLGVGVGREFAGDIGTDLGVHQIQPVVSRGRHVEHRRQRLDVHLDQLGAVFGDMPGPRDDDRDRIPGEADVLVGQRAQRLR